MNLKNVKEGDYVAVYSGKGERAKTVLCTHVRRVTPHTIDLGNENRYRVYDGRPFSYKATGDYAEKVPKAFHDQFVADKKKEREEKEKRDKAWQDKINSEDYKLTRWIQNECEFRFDSIRCLPLWRLKIAVAALTQEHDTETAKRAIQELLP